MTTTASNGCLPIAEFCRPAADLKLTELLGLTRSEDTFCLDWDLTEQGRRAMGQSTMQFVGHVNFHVGLEIPGRPVYQIAVTITRDRELHYSLCYFRAGEIMRHVWRTDAVFTDADSLHAQLLRMTKLRTLPAATPFARRTRILLASTLPGAQNANPPYPVWNNPVKMPDSLRTMAAATARVLTLGVLGR